MDFPTHEKNASRPRQAVEVTKPTVDPNDDPVERFVTQQWRDVADNGAATTHPLSINRDSPHVTTDPYGA